MKWIAISGGWRKTNNQLEQDVRRTVRDIINSGEGIVSGGALGVDYIVTDEILNLNPSADKIRIYLPTKLEIYARHYRKRANEGVITYKQAQDLIAQLEKVKQANKKSLIENTSNTVVNTETYYKRNSKVIESADELIAFHVNKSAGTQDAINKAKKRGIPVKRFEYQIS